MSSNLHLLLSITFAFLWSNRWNHIQNHIVSCLTVTRNTTGDIIDFDGVVQPQAFQCSDINAYDYGNDCKCYWKGTYYTSDIGDTKCYYQYGDTNIGCKSSIKGQEYRGNMSTTKYGKICQAWTSLIPHSHKYNPSSYPNAGLENNYCRNPSNSYGPWCYTMDNSTRFEYCTVPLCPGCKTSIKGQEYRGSISTTRHGRICQAWTSHTPHRHYHIVPSTYPNAGLENNYCRNPDNEQGPWCYTMDQNKRWEYCPVPFCPDNLAKLKPTNQSSTTQGGNSAKAVDGNKASAYVSGSCTHTNDEQGPWWRVDLGAPKKVGKVKITNRGDCCSDRLKNFDVLVGNSDNSTANYLCYNHKSAMGPGQTKEIACTKPITGQFVFIKLKGKNALTLCEVEVVEYYCSLEFTSLLPQYLEIVDLGNGFNKSIGTLSNCPSPAIRNVKYWKNLDTWEEISGCQQIELLGTQLQWKLSNASKILPSYYGLLLKIGLECQVNGRKINQCILLKIQGTRSYPISYTSISSACLSGTSSIVSNTSPTTRNSEVVSSAVPTIAGSISSSLSSIVTSTPPSLIATPSLSIFISKLMLVSHSSLQEIEKTSIATMSSLKSKTRTMIIPTPSLSSNQKVSATSVAPTTKHKKEPPKGGKNTQKNSEMDDKNVPLIAGGCVAVAVIAIAVAVFMFRKRRSEHGQKDPEKKKWGLKKTLSGCPTNSTNSDHLGINTSHKPHPLEHCNPIYEGVITSVHRNPATGDLESGKPFPGERIDERHDIIYENTVSNSIGENEREYGEVNGKVKMENQSSDGVSSSVKGIDNTDDQGIENPSYEDNCAYERELENPYYGGIMASDMDDDNTAANPIYETDYAYAKVDGTNRVKFDYLK